MVYGKCLISLILINIKPHTGFMAFIFLFKEKGFMLQGSLRLQFGTESLLEARKKRLLCNYSLKSDF